MPHQTVGGFTTIGGESVLVTPSGEAVASTTPELAAGKIRGGGPQKKVPSQTKQNVGGAQLTMSVEEARKADAAERARQTQQKQQLASQIQRSRVERERLAERQLRQDLANARTQEQRQQALNDFRTRVSSARDEAAVRRVQSNLSERRTLSSGVIITQRNLSREDREIAQQQSLPLDVSSVDFLPVQKPQGVVSAAPGPATFSQAFRNPFQRRAIAIETAIGRGEDVSTLKRIDLTLSGGAAPLAGFAGSILDFANPTFRKNLGKGLVSAGAQTTSQLVKGEEIAAAVNLGRFIESNPRTSASNIAGEALLTGALAGPLIERATASSSAISRVRIAEAGENTFFTRGVSIVTRRGSFSRRRFIVGGESTIEFEGAERAAQRVAQAAAQGTAESSAARTARFSQNTRSVVTEVRRSRFGTGNEVFSKPIPVGIIERGRADLGTFATKLGPDAVALTEGTKTVSTARAFSSGRLGIVTRENVSRIVGQTRRLTPELSLSGDVSFEIGRSGIRRQIVFQTRRTAPDVSLGILEEARRGSREFDIIGDIELVSPTSTKKIANVQGESSAFASAAASTQSQRAIEAVNLATSGEVAVSKSAIAARTVSRSFTATQRQAAPAFLTPSQQKSVVIRGPDVEPLNIGKQLPRQRISPRSFNIVGGAQGAVQRQRPAQRGAQTPVSASLVVPVQSSQIRQRPAQRVIPAPVLTSLFSRPRPRGVPTARPPIRPGPPLLPPGLSFPFGKRRPKTKEKRTVSRSFNFTPSFGAITFSTQRSFSPQSLRRRAQGGFGIGRRPIPVIRL